MSTAGCRGQKDRYYKVMLRKKSNEKDIGKELVFEEFKWGQQEIELKLSKSNNKINKLLRIKNEMKK